jgi:hypothetical protein
MQKLPGGVLANHGYTVRWGFFSGTCTGSGHRPFETHTDRIEAAIDGATRSAQAARAEASELRQPQHDTGAWYLEHVPADGRVQSFRRWIRVELRSSESGIVFDVNGKTKRSTCYGKGLRETAAEMNAARAATLENDAKKMDEYVAWQRERIAGWTPRPLAATSEPAAAKTTVRTRGARVSVWLGGDVRKTGTVLSSQVVRPFTMVTVELDGGHVGSYRMSWLSLAGK